MIKRSATVSLFAHGLVLLGAFLVLPPPEEFKITPEEAVQVDISKIAATTKLKATTTREVPKPEKPKAEKTETVKKVEPAPKVSEEEVKAAKEKKQEPEPVEKKPEKKPEPKPEPKPEDKPVDDSSLEELLKKEQAAEEEAIALEKKKIEEEKKKKEAEAKKKAAAEEKKKKEAEAKKKKEQEEAKKAAEAAKKKNQKLDVAELEKLLDKSADERTAPKQSSDSDGDPETGEREVQGDDGEVSASLAAALRQKYRDECWTVPPGVGEAGVAVKVTFQLNRDGSLRGQPEVVNSGDGPLFQAAAQAAVSAVTACAPYDWMPPDRYDIWKEINWTFAPKSLGG